MNEHPIYKGFFATHGGDIYTPRLTVLRPVYVATTYKTLIKGKRYSYNKFLMECHLGRTLDIDEVVYPIDGDQTNRKFSNLGIRSKSEHQREVMHKRWQK